MPELLRMPEVAAGEETATLCDWLVGENQQYVTNEVLATIETDKAVVDFTADFDGVLLRILVLPGTEAQVGAPIALIARAGETVEDVDAALAALAATGPSTATPSVSPATVANPEHAPAPPAPGPPVTAAGKRPAGVSGQGGRVFASPLARRLAHDAGIGTELITGTGPNGRIVRHDVELAIASRQPGGPPAQPAPSQPRALRPRGPAVYPLATALPSAFATAAPDRDAAEAAALGQFTDTPHSRVRRAIAQRLSESKQTIPHFYLRGSAQVDDLLELRAQFNEASQIKISINDFVIKAAACAHKLVPAMNVIWTADYVRMMTTVDLGTAVATAGGLVTPVLRGVEAMSISVVATTTRDFAERAREGRLHQHELEGGSSTVTNLGMYGTEEFAAIINPPQSSILAVGAVRKEPVVTTEGDVRPRSLIRVIVSVDHRPIDGTVAAQWMQAFLEILEHPIRLLV
jgi:pyruvate dehydrogenase E2 component (dihydrolipoamide acetyltransferase)